MQNVKTIILLILSLSCTSFKVLYAGDLRQFTTPELTPPQLEGDRILLPIDKKARDRAENAHDRIRTEVIAAYRRGNAEIARTLRGLGITMDIIIAMTGLTEDEFYLL